MGNRVLSVSMIVATALEQLDKYGFADLSMRTISSSLGVAVGALYYHIPNKQSLLVACAREVVKPVLVNDDGSASISDWAVSLRSALLRHRDAGELVSAAVAMREIDLFGPLQRRGLSLNEASAVLFFILGHVMDEQANTVFADFGVAAGESLAVFDARFSAGLAVFVRSLPSAPTSFAG